MLRKSFGLGLLVVLAAVASALGAVGTGYSLFGDASYVSPGNASNRAVKLVTDGPQAFSGVDYALPANLTINDLNSLSTDTFFPIGSTCGGGSPRFAIQLAGFPGKNIFVYIGTPPNFINCPSNVWSNTGNLLAPSSLVDTGQLPGGTPGLEPWSTAQTRYSGQVVTALFVVTDTFAGPRNVIIDNTDVNGTLYDYEFDNKEDCKKGGWQNFTFSPGPFKNQGQCVSHFAKRK